MRGMRAAALGTQLVNPTDASRAVQWRGDGRDECRSAAFGLEALEVWAVGAIFQC